MIFTAGTALGLLRTANESSLEGSCSSGTHRRVPALPKVLRFHSVSKALSFGQEHVVEPFLTLKYIDYFLASGKVDVYTI